MDSVVERSEYDIRYTHDQAKNISQNRELFFGDPEPEQPITLVYNLTPTRSRYVRRPHLLDCQVSDILRRKYFGSGTVDDRLKIMFANSDNSCEYKIIIRNKDISSKRKKDFIRSLISEIQKYVQCDIVHESVVM